MVSMHMRRNLVYLFSKNSCFACKSQSRVGPHFFCTSGGGETQPVISPSVSEFLLQNHHFSPESASRIASLVPCLKSPEKSDSILSFLKESGFSTTQLEKILIYRPRFLSFSLEDKIKPKIKIFQDLGFSPDEVSQIFTHNPSILQRSMDKSLIPSLTVLKGILGNNADVAKLLKVSGWFLTNDLEKNLLPNIEFLKSCGLPMEHIVQFIYTYPRCILLKYEILRRCVDKADEMGINRRRKLYIHAVGIAGSMTEETWEFKLQRFRNLGFSDGDMLNMFRKAPRVLAGSLEKIKNIKEILLATGKYDLSCIVDNPKALMASIEKRYRPRLRVLEILEKKNLITDWPSLSTVFLTPDDLFFRKFVAPYVNEVGDAFLLMYGVAVKREMEPNASA